MKKIKFRAVIFSFIGILALQACNKEEKYSKILLKDDIWRVTELSIEGNNVDFSGEWEIYRQGPSIKDAIPSASWVVNRNPLPDPESFPSNYWKSGTEKDKAIAKYKEAKAKERIAHFNWQFQKKGKEFQITNFSLCPGCDPTKTNISNPNSLELFVRDISGVYKVDNVSKKKNKIALSCLNTVVYSGKTVKITIEK